MMGQGHTGPRYTDVYQTITSMQQHSNFSLEELRLNDYLHDRGVLKRPTSNSFTSEVNGLAFASIPEDWHWLQQNVITCTCRTSTKAALDLRANFVTFRVGRDDPQDFAVHENVVTARSDFVRTALRGDWKEARERVIPLPDDDPASFGLYASYLYFHRIPSDTFGTAEKDVEYQLLVRAYILGERFMDTHFQDAVIDSIIQKLRLTKLFDIRLTNVVYDNTPPDSPLRRLWQDVYVWSGNPNWLDENNVGDFVHAEFALDLSKYQMILARGQVPQFAPYMGGAWTCGYHEHAGGVCYKSLGV